MNGQQVTRILIADDHHVVREGIVYEMNKHADIVVIGEADSGHQTIAKAKELKPDVILLDIGLPDLNGLQVMKRLEGTWTPDRQCRILVLSAYCRSGVCVSYAGSRCAGVLAERRTSTRNRTWHPDA